MLLVVLQGHLPLYLAILELLAVKGCKYGLKQRKLTGQTAFVLAPIQIDRIE